MSLFSVYLRFHSCLHISLNIIVKNHYLFSIYMNDLNTSLYCNIWRPKKLA